MAAMAIVEDTLRSLQLGGALAGDKNVLSLGPPPPRNETGGPDRSDRVEPWPPALQTEVHGHQPGQEGDPGGLQRAQHKVHREEGGSVLLVLDTPKFDSARKRIFENVWHPGGGGKTYLVTKGADSSVLGRCEAGPGLDTARHIEKCAIVGESRDNTCMIRSYSCFFAGLVTLAIQEAVCSLENGSEGGGGLQMRLGATLIADWVQEMTGCSWW